MGQAVDVVWDASQDGVFIVKKTISIMPSWADCAGNAEAAVKDICEDYFTKEIWDDEVGLDDDRWNDIEVEVHSPDEIAGTYTVDLELKITASARLKAKKI